MYTRLYSICLVCATVNRKHIFYSGVVWFIFHLILTKMNTLNYFKYQKNVFSTNNSINLAGDFNIPPRQWHRGSGRNMMLFAIFFGVL